MADTTPDYAADPNRNIGPEMDWLGPMGMYAPGGSSVSRATPQQIDSVRNAPPMAEGHGLPGWYQRPGGAQGTYGPGPAAPSMIDVPGMPSLSPDQWGDIRSRLGAQTTQDPFWSKYNNVYQNAGAITGKNLPNDMLRGGFYAMLQQGAPEYLPEGGAGMANEFRTKMTPQALDQMQHNLNRSARTQQAINMGSMLAALATAGIGGYAAPALAASLGPVGAGATVGGVGGLTNAGIKAAATGNADPGQLALGTATGAAGGALGGLGAAGMVNPMVGSAASGAFNPLVKGLMNGNVDMADVAMGAGTGAATSQLPVWARPFAGAGLSSGYNIARGRRSPTPNVKSTMMSALPSFAQAGA